MANDSTATVTQADMNALNNMPGVQIFVDVSSVQDVCSQWQSKINGLNINVEEIANSFKPLTSYGILTGYVSQLATAIASLLTSINTVTSTISNSSQQQSDADNTNGVGSQTTGGYTYTGGGSSYSSGSSTTGADNTGEDLGINPEDKIESISYQDYLGLSTEIFNILKDYNYDFNKLDDDVVFSKVKAAILSSSFISKELKDKLSRYPDSSLKTLLKLFNQNKTFDNFNVSSIEFVGNYASYLAAINNKSYEGYLSDNKVVYNDLYYANNAITFFDVASKKSNFSEILINAYAGADEKEVGKENLDAIKNIISYVAATKEKTAEDYLVNAKADDFKNIIEAGNLIEDLLKGDTDKIGSLVSNLTK